MLSSNILSQSYHNSNKFPDKSQAYIQGYYEAMHTAISPRGVLIAKLRRAIQNHKLTAALQILEKFGATGELALSFIRDAQNYGEVAL